MSNTRELPWQLDTKSEVLPMAHKVTVPTAVESNVVQVVFGARRTSTQPAEAVDHRSTVLDQVLRKAQLLGW